MNKKSKILATTALTGLLAASPALAESRDYDLATFSSINASTNISVTVRSGESQAVSAKAVSGANLDDLEVTVEDGELKLTTEQHDGLFDFILDGGVLGSFMRGGGEKYEISIVVPKLDGARAAASAEIELDGLVGESLNASASSGGDLNLNGIAYNDITLRASSGGEIDADGSCTKLELRASSGGDIEAFDLECRDATARASSGGNIELTANDTVSLRASSGGDIRVSGGAEVVEQATSSGGNIRRAK